MFILRFAADCLNTPFPHSILFLLNRRKTKVGICSSFVPPPRIRYFGWGHFLSRPWIGSVTLRSSQKARRKNTRRLHYHPQRGASTIREKVSQRRADSQGRRRVDFSGYSSWWNCVQLEATVPAPVTCLSLNCLIDDGCLNCLIDDESSFSITWNKIADTVARFRFVGTG